MTRRQKRLRRSRMLRSQHQPARRKRPKPRRPPHPAAATSTTENSATTTETALDISREALVAVHKCYDHVDTLDFIVADLTSFGDDAELKATQADCDEAALQLDVDVTGPGPGADLSVGVAQLNLALARLAFAWTVDGALSDQEINDFRTQQAEAVAAIRDHIE